MQFLQAVKVFEMNVLRQSGITITPDQLGLKSDPIADLQAKNAATASPFSSLLGTLTGNSTTASALPTPPTPPTDLEDKAAMLKYQQDLLSYNQNYQLYNQRMMQALLQQFQSLQQQQAAATKSASSSSSSSSSSDSASLGMGGILY